MNVINLSLAVLFTLTAPHVAKAATQLTVSPQFATVQEHVCPSLVAMKAINEETTDEIHVCADISPSLRMSMQQLSSLHPILVTGHMTGLHYFRTFVIDSFQLPR